MVLGPGRLHRALGAAGLAMAIAYVFTPGGAGGSPDGLPHLIFWSMRYLAPALAVGLVLLPLLPAAQKRPAWPIAAIAAALIATQFADGPFELWDGLPPAAVLLAPPLAAVAVLAARRMPRAVAAAGAVAVLVAGGWKAQDIYFDGRYTDPASALAGPYAWARDVRDARIGIVGFYLQSPLVGEDLSNHVQYVGRDGGDGEFRSVASCAEWRAELAGGDYDYVVVAPFNYPWGASGAYPREARWTETDPAARADPPGRPRGHLRSSAATRTRRPARRRLPGPRRRHRGADGPGPPGVIRAQRPLVGIRENRGVQGAGPKAYDSKPRPDDAGIRRFAASRPTSGSGRRPCWPWPCGRCLPCA